MKESTDQVSSLSDEQRIQLELLHSVISDDATYVWNPCDPDTVAYIDQLEESLQGEGVTSEKAITLGWQRVSQQANQLWSAPTTSLASSLIEKFESRVPTHLLTQLADKAQASVHDSRTLVDQLVTCVQAIMDGWSTDDLQVMARPLAMAMRDGRGEVLEMTLRSVRAEDWSKLTEVEQVRLSLVVAHYALDAAASDPDLS